MSKVKLPPTFKTMRVRSHVPPLVEEVQHAFYSRHKVTPTISDILVNALKHYKDALRAA